MLLYVICNAQYEPTRSNHDHYCRNRRAAGYHPRDGKHPVLASRTMYVDDPDGNEVEFIYRAPA